MERVILFGSEAAFEINSKLKNFLKKCLKNSGSILKNYGWFSRYFNIFRYLKKKNIKKYNTL